MGGVFAVGNFLRFVVAFLCVFGRCVGCVCVCVFSFLLFLIEKTRVEKRFCLCFGSCLFCVCIMMIRYYFLAFFYCIHALRRAPRRLHGVGLVDDGYIGLTSRMSDGDQSDQLG